MRWVGVLVSIVLILVGIIWILQGLNILPGSVMSGRPIYSVLGLGVAVVGVFGLLYRSRHRSTGTRGSGTEEAEGLPSARK